MIKHFIRLRIKLFYVKYKINIGKIKIEIKLNRKNVIKTTSRMSNNTVIIFSVIGGIGTFVSALYYTIRAYRNKTGPMLSKDKFMKDYSGHFEMDMLPAFVNLVTSIQYVGETLETLENRVGFFSQYRYGSYLITCPLMIYETIHTIGAPYSLSMFSLTLITIMCALFADLAPSTSSRWTWFTIGCTLNVLFCLMLTKIIKHAHRLNDGFCSDKQLKDSIRSMGCDIENFPKGIIRLRTPMDEKKGYIDGVFGLILFLWPVFPVTFCLEHTGCINRDSTQIIFAITDLVIKTSHSYCLDQYKQGLRHTVFSYGFLDTSILYELHIWDDDHDVYSQLKGLSRSMYGDLLVGSKGQLANMETTGLDYNDMLIANRMNRKIDSYEESVAEDKQITTQKLVQQPNLARRTSVSRSNNNSMSPSGSSRSILTRQFYLSSNQKVEPTIANDTINNSSSQNQLLDTNKFTKNIREDNSQERSPENTQVVWF